jgi:outer membrane receptor protein involved in Fe transport
MIGLLVALQLLLSPTPTRPPAVRENVVGTAERAPEGRESIPAAVTVLTREDIERLPANDLGELLRYLPGFHVHFGTPFGGAPMVSARGFFGGGEAEYVQLLVDGVPVSDVESGLADWRGIRAADVERIEALRGPASALYGDTALGGVIQIFTRRATDERAAPLEGENRGRQLKNIPEHLLRPGISVAFPAEIRVEAVATILAGRFLDDAHLFPLDDAAFVDIRLDKRFDRWSARIDILNVTNAKWEEVGYALPDFRGDLVPYYFPAAGFAARLGLEWRF